MARPRDMDRHHQLARRQRRAAHAGDECRERQTARRRARAISTSASSASRAARRRPPARRCRGCRRACRRSGSAGRRPRGPPASGRRTGAAGRPPSSSLQVVGRAEPPARRAGRDAAQNGDSADIEHVLVDRPADPRRVEVGAAGEHRVRPGRRPRQCAQRLFKAAWTKVDTHIVRVRTMPQAPCESNDRCHPERSEGPLLIRKGPRDARDDRLRSQTILERSSRSWRCSWLLSGFRVSRDTAGPLTRSLVIRRWPSVVRLSSVRRASPGCGTRIDQVTFLEPAHHALHRRLVHADETAEMILRELGVLVQLHHARVLGRRDVGIADRDLEDGGGALMRPSQQITDLLFDAVGSCCRT